MNKKKVWDFLEEFENAPEKKAVAVQPPKKTETKTTITETKEVVMEDEFLAENGWKTRGDKWIDPVTRNILIWEAAYAVQQERDRVGSIVETVQHRQSPNRPQPQQVAKKPVAMADYASALLDGVEYDPEVAGQVQEAFASKQQMQAIQNEPVDYSGMTMEDRLLMEAESGGDSFVPASDPDLNRSMTAGLDMMQHASELFEF